MSARDWAGIVVVIAVILCLILLSGCSKTIIVDAEGVEVTIQLPDEVIQKLICKATP